ncbi:MAG: methionyl-tRNA formyltransferase, partial [Candidatus Woesearchaeota archaeon]
AYGQILTQKVLDITKYGVINVHTSLLPKYRGPAPVQWAIRNGEKITGVTIMQTDEGIDTGDILQQEKVEINPGDNTNDVLKKLVPISSKLLVDTLNKIENSTINRKKQDESEATYYPMLKKKDGKIDWSLSAGKIINMVRAFNPWPCAFTNLNGKTLKIYSAELASDKLEQIKRDYNPKFYTNGEVVLASPKKGLFIKTGDGVIRLTNIQMEGSKAMDDKSFINGKKIKEKDILK